MEDELPGDAWRLMGMKATAAVAVPLFAAGLVGWYLIAGQARAMAGMTTGLGQVGSHMPSGMAWPAFMGMWLAMTVAMMLPAIGPVLLAQRMMAGARGGGGLVSAGFVAGYLATWLLVGLVPLVAFLGFGNLAMQSQPARWLQIVGAVVLIVPGVYQLTPLKGACVRACRAPLNFVRAHDATGARGALRAGLSYGAYCVGSCWALMAVLLVVGLMNLVWMAAIALVFFAEKNWRHGVLAARLAGGAVAALGVATVVAPSLLTAISR